MTLILEVPAASESKEQQAKRIKAAVFMFDAQIVSTGQAAEIAGLSVSEFLEELHKAEVSVIQYSAEEAIAEAGQATHREARIRRFEQWAENNARDTPLLSDEAISRETIYGASQ